MKFIKTFYQLLEGLRFEPDIHTKMDRDLPDPTYLNSPKKNKKKTKKDDVHQTYQHITVGDEIVRIPFKQFLKLNALPQFPKEQYPELKDKLSQIFKILGFKITFGEDFSSSNTSYSFDVDPNLNSIPYSLCYIFAQKLLTDTNTPLNNKVYLTSDNYSFGQFSHFSILISKNIKDKKNNKLTVITPSNKAEAYKKIISNFLQEANTTKDKVRCDLSHSSYIPGINKLINDFLTINLKFISKITIPQDIIKKYLDTINEFPNKLEIINNIKTNQPIIYQHILDNNTNVTTASKLGEIGF